MKKLALLIKCKCGGVDVAQALWDGIKIDAELIESMANAAKIGGRVEIVDTDENPPVSWDWGCFCD